MIFIFIPGLFSFISNAMNFFIHSFKQVWFEKKCLRIAGFPQLGALYAIITHNPRSEYNGRKLSVASINGAGGGGVWGCSETPVRPLRKFLGSKDHLNWLKIYLNAAEIITIQNYKHTQN